MTDLEKLAEKERELAEARAERDQLKRHLGEWVKKAFAGKEALAAAQKEAKGRREALGQDVSQRSGGAAGQSDSGSVTVQCRRSARDQAREDAAEIERQQLELYAEHERTSAAWEKFAVELAIALVTEGQAAYRTRPDGMPECVPLPEPDPPPAPPAGAKAWWSE